MKKKLTSPLLSLLAGAATLGAQAAQPKIVVGIVVDQLRTDYIDQLRPYFGENGFNRLMREGVYMPDVDFHHTVSDYPSGAAVVYTGAWPAVNGVASAEVADEATRRNLPTLSKTTGTKTEYSPENIRVSTIADEFFINFGSSAKIYSISGDPQVGVITAGHAGNAAIWLDENSGKWSSPAWYGTIPPAAANKNRTSPLSSRMGASSWRPSNPSSTYPSGASWNNGEFSYSFPGSSKDTYTKFKSSPLFNAEVTDLALDMMKSMRGAQTGMLNVGYSLTPFPADYDGDNRPELFDSYIRLDAELGRLLTAIDKEFGMDRAVVFLSSSGYAVEPEIPDADAKLPTGEITLKQVESLLNSYLSASYGNGDYVARIKDGKLFLASRELGPKGINAVRLRREIKEFLLKMGGVGEVFAIDEILHAEGGKAYEMALGIDAKNAPDLFISFAPGWTVTDDNVYPATTHKVRLSTPATPAFILSPALEQQTVDHTVEATSLAPTISSEINIRAPNAAASRPLTLRRKANK